MADVIFLSGIFKKMYLVYEFFCLNVCLCSICVPGIHGGQKRALDALELELGIVVNHHVGAGN